MKDYKYYYLKLKVPHDYYLHSLIGAIRGYFPDIEVISWGKGKKDTLTKRQKEVLDYVKTLDQITITGVAEHFNCSINSIYGHFKLLEKKGMLVNNHGERPAWQVL